MLVKSNMLERKEHQCLICFQENCSKTVVLPCCSHNLCAKCYERWVPRRLNCPFCRHEFEEGSVQKSHWELLEYRVKDAIEDIWLFESKLETVWTTLEFSSASSKLLATYGMKVWNEGTNNGGSRERRNNYCRRKRLRLEQVRKLSSKLSTSWLVPERVSNHVENVKLFNSAKYSTLKPMAGVVDKGVRFANVTKKPHSQSSIFSSL
jgi:hypothetical protein